MKTTTTLTLGAAVGVTALVLAPAAAAALPAGDYGFTVPGGNPIVVQVADCGFECITLTTPAGFTMDLHVNRRGDRYEGKGVNSLGAICAFDGKPHPASVFYTVKTDGTAGVTEVTGQPCGPGAAVAPLQFTLVPAG
jgi:hypothetical protein